MLAVVRSPKYPEFDNLELERDQELPFYSRKGINPVKTGEIVPDFIFEKNNYRWQQYHNGAETNTLLTLRQLLNKTLILAFYSSAWQDHGLDVLKQLDSIRHEVRLNNANLLIVHAEKNHKLEKIAWDNSLSLNFYFDPEHKIAESFGIYSENDPVWNTFSGIDNNVPLLATYVIASYGRILYDHVERDFSKGFPAENIVRSLRLQELNTQ